MSERSPAFQYYPRDAIADTALLSALEFGVYWRLCSFAWMGVQGLPQCHLPKDDRRLAKLGGVTMEEWEEMKPEILAYFKDSGTTLSHERLLKELRKQEVRAKKLSEAGKKGAKVKKSYSKKPNSPKASASQASATLQASDKPGNSLSSSSSTEVKESSLAGAKEKAAPPPPPSDFAEALPELNGATAVLDAMKHPGGVASTVATLRQRFVYAEESEAIPDPSVKGKPLPRRAELVSAALVEMRDQGVTHWSSRALSGFIRGEAKGEQSQSRATATESRPLTDAESRKLEGLRRKHEAAGLSAENALAKAWEEIRPGEPLP